MKKVMFTLTTLFTLIFVALGITYPFYPNEVLASLITFGMISYHFLFRLAVGDTIHRLKINDNALWFKKRKYEDKIFNLLNIKKLKKNVPTWDSSLFDISKHSIKEIIHNTCVAEVVHEVNIVLSFIPLFLIIPFGSAWVFAVTSVVSALLDSVFVIVQRYNRPRLIRINELQNKRKNK